MLAGILIATGAIFAGIASAGIRIGYFFQPTGMLIVLGGTFGVIFITTPRQALYRAARSAIALLRTTPEKPTGLPLERLYTKPDRLPGLSKTDAVALREPV